MKLVEPKESPSAEEEEEEPVHWVDRWVMPYVEESMLWPVMIVILLHVVAFIVPALLMAFRDFRISAMLAIGIMLYGSMRAVVWERRDRDGLGAIAAMIAFTWALSGVAAYYSHQRGWL